MLPEDIQFSATKSIIQSFTS